MTNKNNPKYQSLVAKLREIFQIDRPELDFGIYRILNARAGEVNDYLDNRLAAKVQAALNSGSDTQREQLTRELKEKEAQYQADGINPDTVPKVLELRQKLAQLGAGANEHENAVFSHLLAFFSRYYEQGDFISQRRYKGDTYAIPYAGEEVMLHWANKDQYYTKSGENFSNYSFKLPEENGEPGRTVHFRLTAADTAKDNRKDNDKERRFALIEKKIVTRVDEEGNDVDEEILPVEELDGVSGRELIIRFEYAVQPKGTKQEALISKATSTVLADTVVKTHWLALGSRAPTEKNPQRTLLEKHLTHYTTKNAADYFIHKDLGGFLRRELDFYIKNEVMNLDDVQTAGTFADIEKSLRMIQCLRAIALDLIAFLAQLENFQKKLWLKKKFVVSSHYCITLDRVPEALYPEIVANEKQWAYWGQLGMWEGSSSGTIEDLYFHRSWMVDTSLFPPKFLATLLNSIPNIEDGINGLIVNGDNFQALNILKARYKNSIDLFYLDPPYNTGLGDFSYKDKYEHSSWLSFLSNLVSMSSHLGRDNSLHWITLDDNEMHRAKLVVEQCTSLSFVATVGWQKVYSPRMDAKQFSSSMDYLLGFSAKSDWIPKKRTVEPDLKQFSLKDDAGRNYRSDPLRKWGKNSLREDRPNLWYPIVSPEGLEVWPIKPDGTEGNWRWKREKVEQNYHELDWLDKGNGIQPYLRQYADNSTSRPVETLWFYEDAGSTHESSEELKALFGYMSFPTPKPTKLIESSMVPVDNTSMVVMDYFAGSGTTGHAVINKNRGDNGGRVYILVEQGEYFETVMKPRLQKVVFSSQWQGGKPTAQNTGISHCIKILKIESYEDTLNNLQLRKPTGTDDLFNTLSQEVKDDYLLNYMLDVESRDSLLSVEDFKNPFDYMLNVAVDSAGAFEPRKIDLVETFNYLIGLRVKHIDAQQERGFVTVTGTLPSGETCLVLWRDCDVLDYDGINLLCDKLAINPADNEFDLVYINGDHNIPTKLTQTGEDGGATQSFKLRQIESEFLARMFSVEDL